MKLKLLPLSLLFLVGCASQPREIGFGGSWRPNHVESKSNQIAQLKKETSVSVNSKTENLNEENYQINCDSKSSQAQIADLKALKIKSKETNHPKDADLTQTINVEGTKQVPEIKSNQIKATSTPKEEQIGWGIASLGCSFMGLLILGLPLGICGIVFGALGFKKKLRGLAIAGLALGIIEVLAFLIVIL